MAPVSMAKLAVCMLGWYGCNAAFNIYNKRVMNEFAFAWAVSWLPAMRCGISKKKRAFLTWRRSAALAAQTDDAACTC